MPTYPCSFNFIASDSPGLTKDQKKLYSDIAIGRIKNSKGIKINNSMIPNDQITRRLSEGMGFDWDGLIHIAGLYKGTVEIEINDLNKKSDYSITIPSNHDLITKNKNSIRQNWLIKIGNDIAEINLSNNIIWSAITADFPSGEFVIDKAFPKTIASAKNIDLKEIIAISSLSDLNIPIKKIAKNEETKISVDLEKITKNI